MTKRLLALLLAVGMILCLCACGAATPNVTEAPTEEVTETPTEEVTEAPTEAEPTYQVTVVDEENNPVVGAFVQLCLEACVPALTDENGVASFYLPEEDYKVGFTVMPAGYEYIDEVEAWYFADGENTMTITIKKAA